MSATPDQLWQLSEVLPEGSRLDGSKIVVVGEGAVFLERRTAVAAAIDELNWREGWTPQQPR